MFKCLSIAIGDVGGNRLEWVGLKFGTRERSRLLGLIPQDIGRDACLALITGNIQLAIEMPTARFAVVPKPLTLEGGKISDKSITPPFLSVLKA